MGINKNSYFQASFNETIESKLYLKDFWLNEDPCYWTVTHYLEKLVSFDPAVSHRDASSRLLNDSKLIKDHVVAGTIAKTLVTSMCNYSKTKAGKTAFHQFFANGSAVKIADSSVKYTAEMSRFRSNMAEHIANAEEDRNRKRRQDSYDAREGSSSGVVRKKLKGKEVEAEAEGFWGEWKKFLENEKNTQHLMHLSPQKHKVLWCGKYVRRRSCLPGDLYQKLQVPAINYESINTEFTDVVKQIEDSDSTANMKKAIHDLTVMIPKNNQLVPEKDFVRNLCSNLSDYIYENCGESVLNKSETCYRSYLFDICLKYVTKYLREKNHDVTFFPGEIELHSMTTQLKQEGMKDRRFRYNADGIIKDNKNNTEILLTEVSSGFGSEDTGKVNFDHYKAMFGTVSMVRTIAQLYNKATFDTFKKLKVHFVHGHGTAVRHWTMSVQAPNIFVMKKEQRVEVPADFESKDLYLTRYIEFYKSITSACQDTIATLVQLKDEHKNALRSAKSENGSILNNVKPVIIRLNEGEHMAQ